MLIENILNQILRLITMDWAKNLIFLFLPFFSVSHIAKAQVPGKEAWHWNFGKNVSLDFSSGVPIAGYSKINVFEGCASMSDPNTGQLLFYTDGDTIWDRNNNRMPNGINLINGTQGTTTQAATILPKPGTTNIFYVITADYAGYPNQGVFYSVVDMNLNAGYGDVSIKNVLLTPPSTTEKVVAIPHCNGSDYWIITHTWNSNDFNAYLLSTSGISGTPVISSVGSVLQNICCSGFEGVGYLKASPDGKKLASCTYAYSPSPFVEVFDFDNSNGQITNPIHFICTGDASSGHFNGAYSCSFSPNNTKLYVTRVGSSFDYLEQFDFNVSGVPRTMISTSNPCFALQLAPNGKIYVGYDNADSLGVINYPDSAGISCNFQSKGVNLINGTNCREGMPNFIDAGIKTRVLGIHDLISCNVFQSDTANAGSGYSHYFWSNGDTTQKIVINSPGKYWVTVTNGNGCIVTDTLDAYVIQASTFDLLHDTTICSPTGSYYCNSSLNGVLNYKWNTGDSIPVSILNNSGVYWVDYTLNGSCTIRDSFNLVLYKRPNFNLGPDSTVCLTNNQPFSFGTISGAGLSYQWSTGVNTQLINVDISGIYWVKITSGPNCYSSDTIRFYVNKDDVLRDTIVCVNHFPFTLDGSTGGTTSNFYAWNGGHIGPTQIVTVPGIYAVTVAVKDPQGNQICIIKDTCIVTSSSCNEIQELHDDELFRIIPNPSGGTFQLEYNLKEKAQMEITDITGKLVGKYNLPANSYKLQITNEQVENGVYLYRIVSNGNLIKTGKIIVMK